MAASTCCWSGGGSCAATTRGCTTIRGRDRCALLLHPADAAARGIDADAAVRLSSSAGSVVVPAELSDEVLPGVVSLPYGFGHGRAGIAMSVAAAHPGASATDVTDDQFLDALTGNAALNRVPVRVEGVAPAAAEPLARHNGDMASAHPSLRVSGIFGLGLEHPQLRLDSPLLFGQGSRTTIQKPAQVFAAQTGSRLDVVLRDVSLQQSPNGTRGVGVLHAKDAQPHLQHALLKLLRARKISQAAACERKVVHLSECARVLAPKKAPLHLKHVFLELVRSRQILHADCQVAECSERFRVLLPKDAPPHLQYTLLQRLRSRRIS